MQENYCQKSAKTITNLIVKFANSTKSISQYANSTVSCLVTKSDHFRRKACQVNCILKGLCKTDNLFFINHVWTITSPYLSGSKLYLKKVDANSFNHLH